MLHSIAQNTGNNKEKRHYLHLVFKQNTGKNGH